MNPKSSDNDALMDDPALASAVYWLSWIDPLKTWAEVGVVVCLAAGVIASFLASPLTKKVDAAKELKIAYLNSDTERLRADNLALQTVLLPRHVGLIGFNESPKAQEWFAGFQQFVGTKIYIQFVPDAEAKNLAGEIAIVLSKFGWKPEFIDEARSHFSLSLKDGLEVYSPVSNKAWNPNDLELQQFAAISRAAEALGDALTKAGLGIGAYRISRVGLLAEQRSPMIPWFDAPLDGVYLQVGARPVSATVEWIKRGRPDAAGNIPASATAPKTK